MSNRGVFEVDRADPLAAGFDDGLPAVHYLHVTVFVDRRDVAGVKPSVFVHRYRARLGVLEIAADDPRAAHQQFTHRSAVMGLWLPGIVDHLHLDPENRPALLALDLHLRLR